LRIASGLVVSDRNLRPDLEVTPEQAYERGRELRDRWHGRGRLRYAVTPRFSVSCSEAMLDACRALLDDGALFTSHVNESPGEIDFVRALFPAARDYLDTYERAGLLGERSVLAHNVHVSDDELRRLAASSTAVAHCPSSNAFLASGIFPMARHVEHGVRFGMGTDVGAGTGLSMLKEGLVAYHVQMVRDHGHMLGPAHLLWLATAAGARALGPSETCGDLRPGNAADLVLVRPPAGSTLEAVLAEAPDFEAALGAVFTLAREESIVETRVGGDVVFARGAERADEAAGHLRLPGNAE
jgi:guanine deaminase